MADIPPLRWCFFRGVGGWTKNENHLGRSPSPKHHNEHPAGHPSDCRKRALKGLKNWGKGFGHPNINITQLLITFWSVSIDLVVIRPFLFTWSSGEVNSCVMSSWGDGVTFLLGVAWVACWMLKGDLGGSRGQTADGASRRSDFHFLSIHP